MGKTWQEHALNIGSAALKTAFNASTDYAKRKIGERVDRAQRRNLGLSPFDLVEVARSPSPFTHLPLEYLFWMGFTFDATRSGNVTYSPQQLGGFFPDLSRPEHRHQFQEFSQRLSLACGEGWIPLFHDGRIRFVDSDSAISLDRFDNLRIEHEDDREVMEVPVCLIRSIYDLSRSRKGKAYRLTFWNNESWDVGLTTYEPFQSMDEFSDERLIELARAYARSGKRR
jgi:hypothetical protein